MLKDRSCAIVLLPPKLALVRASMRGGRRERKKKEKRFVYCYRLQLFNTSSAVVQF